MAKTKIIDPIFSEVICGVEIYKEVNFSAPIDTNLSCGKTTIIDGYTYRIISMVYSDKGVSGTGISINPITKSNQPIIKTSNGEESMNKSITTYDRDVDKILEEIFNV